MYYEVFRTEYLDYDLEENRCDNIGVSQSPTVTDCIENFYHKKLGCNIPWHNAKVSGKQDCSTDEEFRQYQSLAFQLAMMNAREMGQETGCLRGAYAKYIRSVY